MKKGQPKPSEGRNNSKSGSGQKPDALREQAERRLSKRSTPTPLQDARKVLHELEVHQIELEMQNEALRQAQDTITASRERYADLYDFAPVGYFTFDHMGLIAEVNLTGASLLGVERGQLSKKPFSLFVAAPSQDTFHRHYRNVLKTGAAGTCELQLTRKDGTSFHALVQSGPVRDAEGNPTGVRSAIGDITERKQAEETQRLLAVVQEEKDRVSALVNSIQDEVWFADTQKRFTLINPSGLREFGLDDANGIDGGRLAESLETYRPDGSPRPVDEAPSLRALHGEVVRNQEEMIRVPGSGELRYRLVSSAPVRGQNGIIIGSVSVARDITDRKRAEEALRESEARFHRLVEFSPDAILVHAEGKYVYANPTGTRLFGAHSSEEIIGRDVLESIHPDHRQSMVHRIEEACAGSVTPLGEIRFVRLDGSTVDTEVTCRQVEFGGRPAIEIVARDITARKQAENRLAANLTALTRVHALSMKVLEAGGLEPLLQEIMEAAVVVVAAEKGTLQLVEGDSLRIVAHHGHERPFLDFFASAENVASVCGEATKCEERVVVEDVEASSLFAGTPSLSVLRDAGVRAVQSTPLLSRKGELLGILTTQWGFPYVPDEYELWRIDLLARQAADMIEQARAEETLKKAHSELEKRVEERTADLQHAYDQLKKETRERERMEEQLRQAQKMEAVGTLAGGIAHDFNNILAAIIGFTELTIDDAPEGTLIKRNMKNVLKAGIRGRDLVKQILAFSRKSAPKRAPLHLTPVITETFKLLRATTPTTIAMELQTHVASDEVVADPTEISQLLMNLGTNAAHAMREHGGLLEIALNDIEFRPGSHLPHPDLAPGAYLELSLKDTGCGMDAATMNRIFEPFFTTKARGQGTGLGLAVAHGIVQRLGGALAVSSEPGRGSTFTVFLPKVAGEEKVQMDMAQEIAGGKETVLFVDDEELLVEMATEMLGRLGYEVVATTDAGEALRIFSGEPDRFHCVITDYTMPKATGVKLARDLMRIRPDIPIILCTGHSEMISRDEARALGIREFAMKPLVKREIAEMIRRVLDTKARD